MQKSLYFLVPLIGLILSVLLNYDILFHKAPTKSRRAYKLFIYSVIAFFLTDMLWGLIAIFGTQDIFYIATALFYLTMSATVALWCYFTYEYIQRKGNLGKVLLLFTALVSICMPIALILNDFNHLLFTITEDGIYQYGIGRYLVFTVQSIIFLLCGCWGFIRMKKEESGIRKRYHTLAIYSLIMMISILIQSFFYLVPVYSMGYIAGICLLFKFLVLSEAEETRKALENQTKKYEEVTDIISDTGYGIWSIDFNVFGKKTMSVDHIVSSILGVDKMKLSGEELYVYYHERLQATLEDIEDDYASMKKGSVKTRILQWNHPEKGIIYLRAGGTAHYNQDNELIISGYCADITIQKSEEDLINAKLAAALKDAEAASRAKSSFLFNMSHDIRTPMNAIIGYTQLIKKDDLEEEKKKDYLEKIESSSQFLLSLINNVLEMARIESGKSEIEETVVNISDMFDAVNSVFSSEIMKKHLTLVPTIQIEHKIIYSDKTKMNQIFLNLISNAVKYTKEGGEIYLSIEELPCDRIGYARYRNTIRDTGIGMSEEFLPHIFDEFSREKNQTESKIVGTGLGMPIVKAIVEMLGGTITVSSKLNEGTTFVVELENRIAKDVIPTEKKNKSKNDYNLTNKKALLVEDNELNTEIAKAILEDAGIIVDTASNGKECLAKLNVYPSLNYDFILMDIQMPVMDGYQATSAIRAMDGEYKTIPIIAMTANAFEEDKKKAYAVGMNGHISKPIELKVVLEVIKSILYTNELMKK